MKLTLDKQFRTDLYRFCMMTALDAIDGELQASDKLADALEGFAAQIRRQNNRAVRSQIAEAD